MGLRVRIFRVLSFVLLAISIALTFFSPVLAADSLITTHRIPATLANEAVVEAVKACAVKGYKVSAVLLDAGGNTQASLRGDGAGLATLETADHKAYTSVAYMTDTSILMTKSKTGAEMPPGLSRLERLINGGGGIVIKFNDEVIGAIAVSGSPGGKNDEACARAGFAKITDSLK
jgi:uncharacterized protein GlcG (DUF336 family)